MLFEQNLIGEQTSLFGRYDMVPFPYKKKKVNLADGIYETSGKLKMPNLLIKFSFELKI